MKIIKFGGKSLADEQGLSQAIAIIDKKITAQESICIVVSARGNSTDILEILLEKAKKGEPYSKTLEEFKQQQRTIISVDISLEISRLEKLLEGVHLLNDYSLKIKDEVLALGEVISAKTLTERLLSENINANFLDSRNIIITDSNFGNAKVDIRDSKTKTIEYFQSQKNKIQVITGFIGKDIEGNTTTLGRNGSNYTASLLANFLDANELQNYTHVDGIYTVDPNLVEEAQKIKTLSFDEANELANLGANILHVKTIVPLIEKQINLRILNTFNPENEGTLITSKTNSTGIKALTVLKDVALLYFKGRGLLGKTGVDARIFNTLGNIDISISLISQGSSERGIGIVIPEQDSQRAVIALKKEFEHEFYTNDVTDIYVDTEVAVVSMIGLSISKFHLPYSSLIKNQITPLLFNNAITGNNVSLVVKKDQLQKALHVIHGQIFGIAKKVNIVIFGIGLVGETLIHQILENQESFLKRRGILLNIVAVTNSTTALLNSKGIHKTWKKDFLKGTTYEIKDIIDFTQSNHLENLIAIDNTANKDFITNYIPLIENGFDLISSNKIANTLEFNYYKELRQKLEAHKKSYLYETNVGAGLPIIDTIRLLHESGENITKIRGVFSGSLSYIFNQFSSENIAFSKVLKEAITKGYTEPDPREDLCGNDVARKLLILARELDLENDFEEIEIQNLIPTNLREGNTNHFLANIHQLDKYYETLKNQQEEDKVLRYIGELSGDLSKSKGDLSVKLVSTETNSPLGSLTGSDAYFEIYTESYGENPIIIQGAGAGAKVTARGVFGDLLRLAKQN